MAELWLLFITFLKIGAFTFGGGYAMIPLITNAVMQHQWLGVQGDHRYSSDFSDDAGPACHQRSNLYGHQGQRAGWRAGSDGGGVAAVHLHYDGGQQIFFSVSA